MKTTAKIAFTAAAMFAGSAMAFQDSMVDYPQNVAYEQPVAVQTSVAGNVTTGVANIHVDPMAYPANHATPAPTQLTREEVKEELARFVGDNFRIGVSPAYPARG